MLYCHRIHNILARDGRGSYTWEAHYGATLRELAPRGWRPDRGLVEVNGSRVEDLETRPPDCSQVIYVDLPGGPEVWIPIVISAGLSALTTGASMLLQPSPPRPGGAGSDLPPASYRGVQTTVGAGVDIPFVLGEVRIGGHIIESYNTVRFDEIPGSDDWGSNVTEFAKIGTLDTSRLHTRIAWGFGPMELVDHFWIDGNPIENLKGIRYQTQLGTLDQPPLEGFSEERDTKPVGVLITAAGGPVEYHTTQAVHAVLVKLLFAEGLYQIKTSGQPRNRKIQIKVEYKLTSEPTAWTLWRYVYPEAHQMSPTPYWLRLPYLEPGKYDLRFTRITADTSSSSIKDEVQLDEVVEVIAGSRDHPGRAHPGICNTGFQHIPQSAGQRVPRNYTCRAKGLNDVRVYTDPNTYYLAYNRNPAWLFAHWLTHPIIGCGQFFTYDSFEDIGQLIAWGQYCAANNRTFGFEFKRRYSATVVKDMFEMAGNCRIVDLAGKIRIIPNVETSPVKVITPAQYEKDSCSWATRQTDERPTRLSGVFRNAARDYEVDVLMREDLEVEPDQHVDGEVRLWGITTAAKADEALAIMLNESRISDEVFEFTGGASCLDLRAGDVIKFGSLTSGQGVAQGRLTRVESDLKTLRLDQDVTLDSGQSYEITVQHQDGSISVMGLAGVVDDTVETVTTSSAAWNGEPRQGDAYSLGLLGYSTQLLRVEKTEVDLETMRVAVRAVRFEAGIYTPTLVAQTDPADEGVLPDPREIPGAVPDLTLTEEGFDVNVDWGLPASGTVDVGPFTFKIWKYEIYYRELGETSWVYAGETKGSRVTLYNLEGGTTYEVAAVAISPDGNRESLDDASKTSITTTFAT